MIFVTVGTNEAPFERLLRAIDEIELDEEIVVQTGSAITRPKGAYCVPFLEFEELVEHVRKARAVVMHAGVGSIMVALREGRRPIVVPRLRRFGEAVDDHQLHFARRAAAMGSVTLVDDDKTLEATLRSLHAEEPQPDVPSATALARDVRAYIEDTVVEL